MRAAVPFLFLVVPLIEIALFVIVGDLIGLWLTLAATLFSAVLGIVLIRSQGRAAVAHLRPGAAATAVPLASVLVGASVVAAGMLLLVPGFLTDFLGLSILMPPVRRRLGRLIGARVRHAATGAGARGNPDFYDGRSTTIEGEAIVIDDPPAQEDPPRPLPRPSDPLRPRDPP